MVWISPLNVLNTCDDPALYMLYTKILLLSKMSNFLISVPGVKEKGVR